MADLRAEVGSAAGALSSGAARAAAAFERRTLDARLVIDDLFQQCQQRHIAELSGVEKEYAISTVRAQRRPVLAEADLRAHARRLARAGRYEASIRAREQARGARAPEIERRREEIDARFDKVRAAKFARHLADLANLNERLKADLARIAKERASAVAQHRRRFVVAARIARKRAVARATAPVVDPDRKVDIAEAIAAEADALVRAAVGTEIGGSDGPRHDASPRTRAILMQSPPRSGRDSRALGSEGSPPTPPLPGPARVGEAPRQ
jgi:hypothetical protein